MTNADVPDLATANLIENPTNPFTGKALHCDEEASHAQFISLSGEWNTDKNCGNTYLPSRWASVKGNPRDLDNWTFYDGECVLDRHAAP